MRSRWTIAGWLPFLWLPATGMTQNLPEDTTARNEPLTYWGFQMEELELRRSENDRTLGVWDGDAVYGTDNRKFRWRTSGEYDRRDSTLESMENELAVQTPISRFFDLRAGVRAESGEGPERVRAMVGLSGLAPQWFEVDAGLYAGDGEATLELDIEYDWLLTNYWILSAAVDAVVALGPDEKAGAGSGLATTETGLRLRYDLLDRTVSPYLGVVYERSHGGTADRVRRAGQAAGNWQFVAGARIFF